MFTGNLEDAAEVIVSRNIFTILGKLYPSALLSHRSALEFVPTSTQQLFVTYSYTKRIELPGITIRFLKGQGAIKGEGDLLGNMKQDPIFACYPELKSLVPPFMEKAWTKCSSN